MKTLSIQRPRPSMEIATPASASAPVKAAEVNWADSSGRRNTLTGVAMNIRKRRSDRSGRVRLFSPGRPPAAGREERGRFWAAIAAGTATSSGLFLSASKRQRGAVVEVDDIVQALGSLGVEHPSRLASRNFANSDTNGVCASVIEQVSRSGVLAG
jgi:hypothetical protein